MDDAIRLQFEVVLSPATLARIRDLLRPELSMEQKRSEWSRRAVYGSDGPPEDETLLLDTRALSRLLKVSSRTIFSMYTGGEMPKPVRIGRAVRWGRAEIEAWIEAGCPPASKWTWPTSI